MSDLRFALRSLVKSPGFTAIAVLTLALGIGATTALYSIVDGVLLRPLIFPEPDRLVSVVERSGETVHHAVNFENFLVWREQQRSFTSLGAARPWSADVSGPGAAEHFAGAQVTWDYLAAGAVKPLRGRLFAPADDRPEAEPVVVIGEALWRRLFAASDAAIGAGLKIKARTYTVIGVLPHGFVQPTLDASFWVPVAPFAYDYRGHVPRMPGPFQVLGRLKPESDFEQARRDMETVARQLELAQPATNRNRSVVMVLAAEQLFGPVRPALWVLLAATGGVLLIACANVASLQLARTAARWREFSIRAALGAGRLRMARLLLTENLLLGLLGSVGGVLLASWGLDSVRAFLPAEFPRAEEVSIDARVFAFAFGIGLLTVIGTGMGPLWSVVRSRVSLVGGSQTAGSAGVSRWHASLIVTQIALTSVLLVGTGLMLRTLYQLHRTSLGFSPDRVVSFSWSPSVDDEPRRAELVARALAGLAALPGVTNVGMISEMPLGGNYFIRPLSVEGAPAVTPDQQPEGASFSISVDYFAAMQMPLIKGRTFTPRDNDPKAPLVTVIDTRLAERHFPGQDPIGKRIKFGTPGDRRPWVEIVGVVDHVENRGLGQPSGAQSYIPYLQRGPPFNLAFMLRTERDVGALVPEVRQLMREIAPELPIYAVATMDARFRSTISSQRLTGILLGSFAALALLLAAVGLYGVLHYQVGQRTREIGIRMALGAAHDAVLRLIVGKGLRLAGLGLALGLAGAWATTHLLSSLLYRTPSVDSATFGAVAALLAIVVLLACWLPARRATRVNPLDALRTE